MITNRSAPNGTIVPSLIYSDLAKAIQWLCDVFGFTERLRVNGADGTVGHAQLAIGMGGILLGTRRTGQSPGTPDRAEFRPPRPDEVSQVLSIHIDNVDAHHERAKARGARILLPPQTHVYGERQYSAEDLEGHRWTFSQSVADIAPEQWGATAAALKGPIALLPRPRFCYLEIPALDLAQSVAFYEKVFGWNIRHRDTARPSFDDATGFVSGAWVTGRGAAREPGLLPYVYVDDLDTILGRVEAHGGMIAKRPQPDSPKADGWIALVHDPAGNVIGLYSEPET
jgi:uncharacterized glyoxalase superfamily protein PhnB